MIKEKEKRVYLRKTVFGKNYFVFIMYLSSSAPYNIIIIYYYLPYYSVVVRIITSS